MRQLDRGYSNARVGNGYNRVLSVCVFTDADSAARLHILRCIRDQVREYLCQPSEVPVDEELFRSRVDRQLMLAGFDQRMRRLDAGGQSLPQRIHCLTQSNFPGTDPGDVEQIIDEANQVRELPLHYFECRLQR